MPLACCAFLKLCAWAARGAAELAGRARVWALGVWEQQKAALAVRREESKKAKVEEAKFLEKLEAEGLSRLARLNDKSVLIGFSAGRPSALVVRALRLARHRQADTIAISDSTLSELTRYADQRLYYSSNSPSFVRSNSALLGLIQALAFGVYSLDESIYADRIKAFRLK